MRCAPVGIEPHTVGDKKSLERSYTRDKALAAQGACKHFIFLSHCFFRDKGLVCLSNPDLRFGV